MRGSDVNGVFDQLAAGEEEERTSTADTQSSCSKEAVNDGGIEERTYCKVRVVSEERPAVWRYSARVERRKVPLMRMSKGTGEDNPSIDSELRIWERL